MPNANAVNVLEVFETYSRTGSLNETLRRSAGLSGIPQGKNTLKRMLQNVIYIGKHPSGVDSFCDPIVPTALFEDVQRKLAMNIKSSQKELYIFSGLIKCAECGRAFGSNTRRRKRGAGELKIIHQYRCSRHYNFKPPLCNNAKVILETALEKHLINNLSELMKNAILQFESETKPSRDRAAQISVLKKKMDRIKELFINDLITLEEYKSDREMYECQINSLKSEQTMDPEAASQAAESLRAILQMDFKEIYKDLNPEERRRFWRGIIKFISVAQDRTISVEFIALSTGTK